MNVNLKTLIKACEQMGIPYQTFHSTTNIVQVNLTGRLHLFINWATPCNPQAIAHLCRDKDYFYTFFSDAIAMPKTRSFFDPNCRRQYTQYLQAKNLSEILAIVAEQFSYPLVVKRNSGSWGRHVFQVDSETALTEAIQIIFDSNNSAYDYVALVQEWIDIQTEYRVVYLQRQLALAYEKDITEASFIGNLSPLHWQGAKAVLVTDPVLLQAIDEFCQPLFDKLTIPFCGLDIALDRQNRWWCIEANSSPGFDHIVAGGGEAAVVNLYKQILQFLAQAQVNSL